MNVPITTAVLDKWVDDMQSGKYKFGIHLFRSGDCFCSYGVLLDQFVKEGLFVWHEEGLSYTFQTVVCDPKEDTLFINFETMPSALSLCNIAKINDASESYEPVIVEVLNYLKTQPESKYYEPAVAV